MIKVFFCILLCLSPFLSEPAFRQNDCDSTPIIVSDTINNSSGLFESSELLDISLRFDISYYKKKKPNKEYLDAIITYHTSEKDSVSKPIKVRSRGLSRRNICDFPPLMLSLNMKDSTGGKFSRIDKLKIVTHCKIGFENYILKEYLIYKLYNVLTDNSFRVRLLRVNYISTSKRSRQVLEYAFAIEPVDLLTKRVNSIEVKTPSMTQYNIIPEMMDRMAIFNYMIGNTDWSVPIRHNVAIFLQPNSVRPGLGLIVPYDFDYSGLVNASYAVPYEGLGLESVRDRLYLGICRNKEVLINELKEFSDRKDDFYKIIREFPYLNEKSKDEMIGYLNSFYNQFDKRNTIVYNLLRTCK